MRNVKTGLRVFGFVCLGFACCMGLAQLFFGWSPTITDEWVRVIFTFLGLVFLGIDSFLPG